MNQFSEEERICRLSLAAAYRLFDIHGYSEIIYNHITVRIPSEPDHFLINPFGVLFSKITASMLIKVDIYGKILYRADPSHRINDAGFVLHSAIHETRRDINCVMHTHHTAGLAVSIMKDGLLPLSISSLRVGPVSYHDFEGITTDLEEKKTIVRDLGLTNKILILRNHGLVTCGTHVQEAFMRMFLLVKACETQLVVLAAVGGDKSKLIHLSPEVSEKTYRTDSTFNTDGYGILEFEALCKELDKTDESYKY